MSTSSDRDDYAMRQWAAAVFNSALPRRRATDNPPASPNHVAGEGANADLSHAPIRYVGRNAMRNWVGDLFGTDENARGLHRDGA